MLNQDVFLTIESAKLKFTAVDEQISTYFLEMKPPLKQSELARKINVSTASITRFCKKIGFDNYQAFIYCYQQDLVDSQTNKNDVTSNLQFQYKDLINTIDEKADIEKIEEACRYIHSRKIIHVYGLGLSAIAGEDFKFRFTRVGKFVEVVRDYESIEMISSLLNADNLVIYFSLRGENQRVIDALKHLKAKGANLIVVTANESFDMADINLITSHINNPNEAGQISAQLPLLVIIDFIYLQYIRMYRENIKKWIGTESAYLHGHK